MAKNRKEMLLEERAKFRETAAPDARVAAALELIADSLERTHGELLAIRFQMERQFDAQQTG